MMHPQTPCSISADHLWYFNVLWHTGWNSIQWSKSLGCYGFSASLGLEKSSFLTFPTPHNWLYVPCFTWSLHLSAISIKQWSLFQSKKSHYLKIIPENKILLKGYEWRLVTTMFESHVMEGFYGNCALFFSLAQWQTLHNIISEEFRIWKE